MRSPVHSTFRAPSGISRAFDRCDRCTTFDLGLTSGRMARDADHSGNLVEPACRSTVVAKFELKRRLKRNVGDVRRNLGMTSAGSSSAFSAFATPDAGFEYLVTAEHYQYLARGIVDALRRGALVLVTGDPPASLPLLAEALRKAAAPRRVIEISCGPELDLAKPVDDGSAGSEAPTADGAGGEDFGRVPLHSPILVFAGADRLSDGQIKDLLEAAHAMPPEPHAVKAGVLLAHSAFLARFERPELHLLEEGFAAHFGLQQLERDEIEAFIRHQLPPGKEANLFTPQRVALIALTSGGDPAVVNRLARRMLEIEPGASAGSLPARLSRAWRRRPRKPVGEEAIAEPGAAVASVAIGPPRPRRYPLALRLPAGIIMCLGAVWLIVLAFGSHDLDAVVGLLRARILAHNETAGVPAGMEPASSPKAAVGSSSVGLAAVAPSAAPAREAVSEPAPTGAAHPGDAPSSRRASEPSPRQLSAAPRLSAAEIAALVARGDAFLGAGDLASARLFFERAADAGDGHAAMRMAVTYDAAFLERAGLRGLRGDPEQATLWYRRARELGEAKAEPPLGGLESSPSPGPPLQPR